MKQIVNNYTFNPAAKTLILGDYASVKLNRLLLITNVTVGKIIYQFNSAALGATVNGNTLTLNADLAGMNVGDNLQIIYDSQSGDPLYDTASGNGTVEGNVPSGAVDGGNPVKIGGVYRATQPTFTDGQRVDAQFDIHGNQLVTLATGVAGEDFSSNVLGVVSKPVSSSEYSALASVVLGSAAGAAVAVNAKNVAGILYSIYANNRNADVRYLQIFNNHGAPAAGATPMLSFAIPAGTATSPGVLQLPGNFFGPNGLYVNKAIGWAVSTTPATLTLATVTDHDVHVFYI